MEVLEVQRFALDEWRVLVHYHGWLWVVKEGVPRLLIHISDIKAYSTYVAIGSNSGFLVLMDRNR